MPFNITDFHANISKTGGVALSSNFFVEVPNLIGTLGAPGQGTASFLIQNSESMTFRIDSINLPPRSVSDVAVRDFGAPRRIGLFANYLDVTMTVIVSPDLRERSYFLKWQDLVVGNHRVAINPGEQSKGFSTGYYSDYVSDGIKIKYYSEASNNPIYVLQLIDAYPILVGDLSMSWSQPDVLKMSVVIAYRYFVDAYTNNNSAQEIEFNNRING